MQTDNPLAGEDPGMSSEEAGMPSADMDSDVIVNTRLDTADVDMDSEGIMQDEEDEEDQRLKAIQASVAVRAITLPSLPVSAAADLGSWSQASMQSMKYVEDPNAKGITKTVAGGLTVSKQQADKFKQESRKTRDELRALGARYFVVHPEAPWLKVWDFVQAMIITYLFVGASLPAPTSTCIAWLTGVGLRKWFAELPIRFAFINTQIELNNREEGTVNNQNAQAYTSADVVVDVLMLLDFLLRFCRAFYDYDYHGQQHLRVKPTQIAEQYLKHSLVRDTFACLPLDTIVILLGHPQTASAVRLLRLLRVERVVTFKRTIDSYVDRSVGRGWLRPVVSGTSLVLGTFFFNHVLACALYKVGSELYDEPGCELIEDDRCGWVKRMQYELDTGIWVRYTDSFYFTFTILTTVGFGDITARSTLERVVAVVAMTAGCAIFGIVMGQITAVIHGMNMGLQHYEERVRELEQYMAYRDVNQSVRERVKRFIVEKFPEKRVYDERSILNSLPPGLRTEFQMDMYLEHVLCLPFLPSDDREVLERICRSLRQDTVMPGEVIVREGTILRNVYTVVSGTVAVLVPALDSSRANSLRPAGWMLSDEELLEQHQRWLDEDSGQTELAREALPAQDRDFKGLSEVVHVEGKRIRATRRLRKDQTLDVGVIHDGGPEWLTLAQLTDSHYFCEQCLSYESPSLKRYQAKHLSTIGVLPKDVCAALMLEFPSVRASVRSYTLVKFEKMMTRLKRHMAGQKLPAAALADTRFEANMMCRVIEGWGGRALIKKGAVSCKHDYISTVERTYANFRPTEIGIPLSHHDIRDMVEKKRQTERSDTSMSDIDHVRAVLERIEDSQTQLMMQSNKDHHRIAAIERELQALSTS